MPVTRQYAMSSPLDELKASTLLQFAERVYESVFEKVVVVSSAKMEEDTILSENFQRFVKWFYPLLPRPRDRRSLHPGRPALCALESKKISFQYAFYPLVIDNQHATKYVLGRKNVMLLEEVYACEFK